MRMTVIIAVLLTAIGSGAALAQGAPPGSSWQDTVIMIAPNGSVVQRTITDRSMMNMMMQGATPLRPGTMVMVHNGKMYMIPDKKMSNGRMLSEEVRDLRFLHAP